MLRTLGFIAALVYALSLVGALAAPRTAFSVEDDWATEAETVYTPVQVSSEALASLPALVPAAPDGLAGTARGAIIGFTLNLHFTQDIKPYLDAVDQLASLGYNAIEVLTPAFQENGASQEIRIEEGVGRGPKREHLVQLLKHAKSKGMRTHLMPIVLLANPRGNEWRGKIQPENWDAWWASYRRMADHFLSIANEAQVSIYCVGSELLGTEKQTDRWTAQIAYVRSKFRTPGGKLAYSTNWDHYTVPTFWKQLDYIGINGYWDISVRTDELRPDPAALVQVWKEIRKQVMDFAASQGKEVLLTEIGYPSLPWALKSPWNYIANDTPADPAAQFLGYRAFLAAWNDVFAGNNNEDGKRLAGVFFYEWDPHNAGGPEDTGYGIRGKPTFELLKTWLEKRAKK